METVTLRSKEQKILDRLCAGWTDKEIAKDVHLSPAGVKWVAEKLKTVYGAANRHALAFVAGSMMLVDLTEVKKLSELKLQEKAQYLTVFMAIIFGMCQETFWWSNYDEPQRRPTSQRLQAKRVNQRSIRVFGRDVNFIIDQEIV